MSRLVILDAGPLGMATNPKSSPLSRRATEWLSGLLAANTSVAIPEVADYEVRRELLRTERHAALQWLDDLRQKLLYLPITTAAMLRAAEFWATCRKQGFPLADPRALDCDVILAAQSVEVASDYDETIIATTNPAHLSRLVRADYWENIA